MTCDKGHPVSIDDDLLSAVRQVVMGIRHAKEMKANGQGGFSRRGSNADLNTPEAIAKRNNYDKDGLDL